MNERKQSIEDVILSEPCQGGNDIESRLAHEIDAAANKALDALARYKFQMFGYWAGIWVHLNRIEGKQRPSPFRGVVAQARARGFGPGKSRGK